MLSKTIVYQLFYKYNKIPFCFFLFDSCTVFMIKPTYFLDFQPKSPNILTRLGRIYAVFIKIDTMFKSQKIAIFISQYLKINEK